MPAPHASSEAFYQVLADAKIMHDRKQADYGTDNDPFANVRSAVDYGLPAHLGCAIRMGDKTRRLESFYKRGNLVNEGAEDAVMDLLVYCGIWLVLFREEMAAGDPDGLADKIATARAYLDQAIPQ